MLRDSVGRDRVSHARGHRFDPRGEHVLFFTLFGECAASLISDNQGCNFSASQNLKLCSKFGQILLFSARVFFNLKHIPIFAQR